MEQTRAALTDRLTEDVDPDAFTAIVRDASEEELAELLASEHRDRVLGEVFERMPQRLKREKAAGVDAVIHWRIGDRPDGGDDLYEIVIADGDCRVSRTATARPNVTFRIRASSFLRLIAGATTGVKLVLGRKLRVEGDMQLAMRVEGLFERG
jgi:putative sterol carrier protein